MKCQCADIVQNVIWIIAAAASVYLGTFIPELFVWFVTRKKRSMKRRVAAELRRVVDPLEGDAVKLSLGLIRNHQKRKAVRRRIAKKMWRVDYCARALSLAR